MRVSALSAGAADRPRFTDGYEMSEWMAVVGPLAVLVLVGHRLPLGRWPALIAVTLAVVIAVVLAERSGLWPATWRVR